MCQTILDACYSARVEHARVDPHVNCFIPRRLHTLGEYEKEHSYNCGRRRRKREKESLLVYERDMTAAPRLYITLRHSRRLLTPLSLLVDQCAGLKSFVSTRGTPYRPSEARRFAPLRVPRVNSRAGKMDFRCTR